MILAPLTVDDVLDPGVGQRDHGRAMPHRGDGIVAGQAVEVAPDLVGADLHRDVLRHRPVASGGVTARAAGVDEAQLGPRHHQLVDLEGRPVVEPLDGDADERVLVGGVEHVAEAIGVEGRPT